MAAVIVPGRALVSLASYVTIANRTTSKFSSTELSCVPIARPPADSSPARKPLTCSSSSSWFARVDLKNFTRTVMAPPVCAECRWPTIGRRDTVQISVRQRTRLGSLISPSLVLVGEVSPPPMLVRSALGDDFFLKLAGFYGLFGSIVDDHLDRFSSSVVARVEHALVVCVRL